MAAVKERESNQGWPGCGEIGILCPVDGNKKGAVAMEKCMAVLWTELCPPKIHMLWPYPPM